MTAQQPIAALLGTETNTDPGFGKTFTPHMLMARHAEGQWDEGHVRPFAKLVLAPTCSALHYGQSVFEGLKAYRNGQGKPFLFRPKDHFARINQSAKRLCMPEVPEEIFMGGIERLLRQDQSWIPSEPNRSLYIRPIYFATDESIGLRVGENYLFVVMASPVGAYHRERVSLHLSHDCVRSHIGGTGYVKAAGNYAAGLAATMRAKQEGFDDVLWVDSQTRSRVEECGTMNVFFVFRDLVVTPSLTGTILPGVTRDSILHLLALAGRKVEKRPVPISELIQKHASGELTECFGAGTAASITPVSQIGYEGRHLMLPDLGEIGVAMELRQSLNEMHRGALQVPEGWIWPIE